MSDSLSNSSLHSASPNAAKHILNRNEDSLLQIALRDFRRLREVTGLVVKHGFGELIARSPLGRKLLRRTAVPLEGILDFDPSHRLKRLLEELGPCFIKFGQIVATRPDLLSPAFSTALSKLQDQAQTVSIAEIRRTIELGLGKAVEDIFASFSDKPLGSASIAQTHIATLKSGQPVVVKVQRAGIEGIIRSDIDLLYLFAKILESSIEEIQFMAPSLLVREFERAILRELDFGEELKNLQAARQYLDPEFNIIVPRPFPEYSCRSALTMEYFSGISLRNLEKSSPRAHCS